MWLSQKNQEKALSPLVTCPCKSQSNTSILLCWSSSHKVNPGSRKGDRPHFNMRTIREFAGIFWAYIWAPPQDSGRTDFSHKKNIMSDFLLWTVLVRGSSFFQEIKRHFLLGRKAMTNLDSILKSRDITWPTKVHLVKAMVFPVVMYGCESWTIKKAEHRRIDAFELLLEKTLESPLDCKAIQPVNPKGNPSWLFIGRTDAEAETPILWPPDAKNWLTEKDPDAGKDWRREEKGMTKDEMVGWHHQLNGHEFEQALGIGDGQGSMGCCSPWGRKELDMTEWLNWTEHHFLTSLRA